MSNHIIYSKLESTSCDCILQPAGIQLQIEGYRSLGHLYCLWYQELCTENTAHADPGTITHKTFPVYYFSCTLPSALKQTLGVTSNNIYSCVRTSRTVHTIYANIDVTFLICIDNSKYLFEYPMIGRINYCKLKNAYEELLVLSNGGNTGQEVGCSPFISTLPLSQNTLILRHMRKHVEGEYNIRV